jgi:O-methyltransferase
MMANLGRPRCLDVLQAEYTNEYVRLSQLELAIHEIKQHHVPGDVAEVGVYKGTFAAVLNRALPDRMLYLFDTFDGFNPEQERTDKEQHGLKFSRDFSDTSVEFVLGQMPHRDKCIVRKGLFPATTAGLENCRFCFVSLDADLYEPILAGLEFFFDRMSAGGFIFVHDYNNAMYPGAKQAVLDFAQRRSAPFIPVTDIYGTAIFPARATGPSGENPPA